MRRSPIRIGAIAAAGVFTVVAATAGPLIGEHQSVKAAASSSAVLGWGWNRFGQLGDGTSTDTYQPVATRGLPGQVVQVVAAYADSYAICRNCDPNLPDTVWAWGDGEYDQLGVGAGVGACPAPTAVLCSGAPVEVRGAGGLGHLGRIVRLASVASTVLALDSGGSVWAWGYDAEGQAGPGPTAPCPGNAGRPCAVYPERVPVVHDAVDVATGNGYSLAVARAGTVWAWGENTYGELGQGTDAWSGGQGSTALPLQVKNPKDPSGFLQGITAVSSSGDFTLGLQHGAAPDGSQNTVWAWGGYNDQGQLGTGYLNSAGSGSQTPAVNYPQQVVAQAGGSTPFTGALALAAGWVGSAAVRFDASGSDTLWGWGYELADGGTGDYAAAVGRTAPRQLRASGGSPCDSPGPFITGVSPSADAITWDAALATDGTLWLWGNNDTGQIMTPPNSPSSYCQFAIPAPGVTASAVGGAWYSHLVIGQVVGPIPPPTPTRGPSPTAPPVMQGGPAPGTGPGATPPQAGLPAGASQPGGFPAAAQGQPPGPGAGASVGNGAHASAVSSSHAAGSAPMSGPSGQTSVVSVPGSSVAPAAAAAPRTEPVSGSAEEFAMVRHDGVAPPTLALTGGAGLTLVWTLVAVRWRRRSGIRPSVSPASASHLGSYPQPLDDHGNIAARDFCDCDGRRRRSLPDCATWDW